MVEYLPADYKLVLYDGGDDPLTVGLLNTHLVLGDIITYNQFDDETASDSDKLRLVAIWLDTIDDIIMDRLKARGSDFEAGDSIQKDLMRIADELEE